MSHSLFPVPTSINQSILYCSLQNDPTGPYYLTSRIRDITSPSAHLDHYPSCIPIPVPIPIPLSTPLNDPISLSCSSPTRLVQLDVCLYLVLRWPLHHSALVRCPHRQIVVFPLVRSLISLSPAVFFLICWMMHISVDPCPSNPSSSGVAVGT